MHSASGKLQQSHRLVIAHNLQSLLKSTSCLTRSLHPGKTCHMPSLGSALEPSQTSPQYLHRNLLELDLTGTFCANTFCSGTFRNLTSSSAPEPSAPEPSGISPKCLHRNPPEPHLGSHLTNQSINQSINESVNPSIDPSINHSVNHAILQSILEPSEDQLKRYWQGVLPKWRNTGPNTYPNNIFCDARVELSVSRDHCSAFQL